MKLKEYIGNKAFYKMTLGIAVPMMVQNLISSFVSLLDNVMVGALGTEDMSAVSIVNQLYFVFTLALFGAVSGAGIFTSQFHGKNDDEGIRYTIRFKTVTVIILTAVASLIFIFAGDILISLFLHEGDNSSDLELTATIAKKYLNIIIIGLLPFAISNIFSSTLRETGQTVIPMITGFVAVFVNCILNYILIFGKFGFPALGAEGAAIATVIAKFVECAVFIIYVIKTKKQFPFFKGAFKSIYVPKDLLKRIVIKGMPLLLNEFLWAAGMSVLSMSYSLHGIAVVAGFSISSTIVNLLSISFQALGSSISIIAGKLLGAGKFDEAISTVKKMFAFTLLASVIAGVCIYFTSNPILNLYNTSEESKSYAEFFMKTVAFTLPLNAFAHASYFTLRSGGKTFVTFIFDSVFLLGFVVPLAFALFYIGHLSIFIIFPIIQCSDIIKDIIGFVFIKKKVWVVNIVN
ncbi:MAG: MATE family efflux transporter [Clostridia bacterium]|nr:MATE family efflux transporter [Clostridia bacterium]